MRRATVLGVSLAVLLGLAAPAVGQRGLPERTTWWDDPTIVEQLEITDAQRAKMTEVFSELREQINPRRYNAVTQKPFLEALEKGEWDEAREQGERWVSSLQGPKRAMIELKLRVLPILSAEQRGKMISLYPRLIRRSWAPAARWTDAPPADKGPAPKK